VAWLTLAALPFLGQVRAEENARPAPSATELLSNHDFSSAKKDPSFPDDWHRKPWMTWEIEKGFHFLRLSTTTPAQEISAGRELGLAPGVKAVQVSIRYRTNGVKLTGAKGAGLGANLVFLDAVKIRFAPPPDPLVLRDQAHDWMLATAKIAVPDHAATLGMSVGMLQVQSGTLDLADVSVKPIAAEDVVPPRAAVLDASVSSDQRLPIRRDGAHTIIGFGTPTIWFIHPYVDVLGHDFDTGVSHLVQQAREKGRSIAVGVAGNLDEADQADAKDTIYVFSYKNINFPLPAEAHRIIFLNTWLLPETKWPASRTGKKDVVLIGSKSLHNDGDGLATNKDRWWQIQKNDPDLELTVLADTGYYLPMSLWCSALLKVILEEPLALK
jgi:hypothetical protein